MPRTSSTRIRAALSVLVETAICADQAAIGVHRAAEEQRRIVLKSPDRELNMTGSIDNAHVGIAAMQGRAHFEKALNVSTILLNGQRHSSRNIGRGIQKTTVVETCYIRNSGLGASGGGTITRRSA